MAGFKIVRLTDDLVPGAIDVLREAFFTEEKVCQCVNILTDSPEVKTDSKYKCTKGTLELEGLVIDTVKDGVSVVAVDEKDNKHVLGVAFNKIQIKNVPYFEQYAKDNIKDESANGLVDFMIRTDSKLDMLSHFKVECSLEIMFLAVQSTEKGKGIGQALIRESIKAAKGYSGNPQPGIVTAIFTSAFSQKAGQRAGMSTLLEVKTPPGTLGYFQQYTKDKIKDPSTVKIMEFMIYADSIVNLFEKFNVDCALELMFLGVRPRVKGRGIGLALIKETIEIAKSFEGPIRPGIVCALFSSRFSQKAGARAGFKTLAEIPYDQVSYKGRPFIEVTGPDHPFCTLSAINLSEYSQ